MIKKRADGKWLLNLQPGGRSGPQVKRVFSTQGEAKQFQIWYQAQHQQDPEWTPAKADSRRLKDLIETWYGAHGVGLRAGPNTKARLLALAEKLRNPLAAQLTAQDFDEYRQARIKEGKALQTINREHSYLRAVFNELRRLGQWSRPNPLTDVRQFKTNERELTYLTHDQIDVLFDALDESRNVHVKLIAKICLSTGGRWGETETLRSTQARGNVVQFANQTKSKKARAVPIAEELQGEIDAHASEHGEDQRIFGSAYAAFLEALDRADLKLPKGQASHVLRHTFASHFMIGGGNIIALQRILGHQSLAMTMRYAHLAPDHLREAVKLNPMVGMISRRNSVGSGTKKKVMTNC